MPTILGTNLTTFKTYIVSVRRTMSVTTYWEPASVPTDSAFLKTQVNAYQDAFAALIGALMPDQVSIPTTYGVFTNSSTQLDTFSDAGNSQNGTAATVIAELPGTRVLPDQDAVLIQKRTGLSGRSKRGRIFIPCIWEDFNSEGQLTTDGMTAAKEVADFMGADRTWGGVVHHARHYMPTSNTVAVITECRAMVQLVSRRDRAPNGPNLPVG